MTDTTPRNSIRSPEMSASLKQVIPNIVERLDVLQGDISLLHERTLHLVNILVPITIGVVEVTEIPCESDRDGSAIGFQLAMINDMIIFLQKVTVALIAQLDL